MKQKYSEISSCSMHIHILAKNYNQSGPCIYNFLKRTIKLKLNFKGQFHKDNWLDEK